MDSASGGDKEGGDNEGAHSSLGSLHDHSDLLIPNSSFISSPGSVSSTSSMMMNVTSPTSENSDSDLYNRQLMDCQMTSPHSGDEGMMDGQMDQQMGHPSQPDSSPPNVIVDDSPLQPCMERNKQSLKVKLLMRRPMNQLVEQGILPPPKTPAAFAGQRVRLERARMGDLLKAKIQQRPARQELIRQHILEDTDSRVAPSLAEKQRMLKRARLADSLNDHLIHRPGPLELVQKNILHAPDADIEKAIKEGLVTFKSTSEGSVAGPSLPCKYTVNEDDSSSDISSPAGTPDASSSGPNTEANTPISKQLSDPAIFLPSPTSAATPATPTTLTPIPAEPCEVILQAAKPIKSEIPATITQPAPQIILAAAPHTLAGSAQQLAQAAAIFQVAPATTAVIPPPPPLPTSTTVARIPPPPPLPPLPQTIVLSDGAVRELIPQLQSAGFQLAAAAHVQKPSQSSSSSLGKSRSSKKSSKSKSQPKARTIKFHEYKGPSSCQPKGSSSSNSVASALSAAQSKAESSYELLLKQQQLFLQWQLEWQHKYPQILLPAAPKLPGTSVSSLGSSSKATLSSFPVTAIPASLCTHLLNSNNQQNSSQQPTPSTTITVAPSMTGDIASPRPVTLAPKMTEIAPKPPETETKSNINDPVPSPASSNSSEKNASVKPHNLSNISDWKVNDLKAELKKRSLPVSGSKSQLVERLKSAISKDSINETKPASVKMEVASGDENSNEAMMDVSANDENNASNKGNPQPASQAQPTTVVIGAATSSNPQQLENNNISILDLANGKLNGVPISLQNILSLLGVATADGNVLLTNNNNPAVDNNIKNATTSGGVQTAATTTAKVISQLPISTVVATAAKAAAASNAEASTSSSQNSKFVDENKILEQQKQILELQKALRTSQQQLQQLSQQKDPKNGGPQKHRLVLQQHIQQKLQQQAIQTQLQNLIQLQTQQAEQKKQLLQQQQQQQQQAQTQPQLVLFSSNSNQPITSIGNNILPLTIVSQAPQQQQQPQVELSNNWIPQQQQQPLSAEGPNKASGTGPRGTLNFEDLVKNIEKKNISKLETEDEARKRDIKSQMVDDVLEILIRNGELPPSAAQDPKSSTHPTSSGATSSTQSATVSNGNSHPPAPPPPPPLPPPTFSVMLPTTIPFSRHQTSSNTDFLSFGSPRPRTDEHLSKDAQEILRICEDLTNFGKSREAEAAQAAANARLENGNMDCGFFAEQSGPPSTSTDKMFDLSSATHPHNSRSGGGTADSMDIGFGDTHSVSLHSPGNKPLSVVNHQYQNSPYDSGTFSFGHSNAQSQQQNSTFKPHHDHHHNFMSDDELLPVSLDMQMDTDYSDWLDALLPDSGTVNNTSASTASNPSSTNLFHHQPDTNTVAVNKMISEKRQDHLFNHNNNLSNSNSETSSNGPNIFGTLLDDHVHQQQQQPDHGHQQRDPLLSSRSFTTRMNNSNPFITDGQLQQNNFIFSSHPNQQQHPLLIFHNPSSVSSTSSNATMMDTDFDELTTPQPPGPTTNKKSENIHNSASSHNNLITEMPSTTTNIITPIITTTSSINDNFLWDFAM